MKALLRLTGFAAACILMSSCATIVGGQSYTAYVQTPRDNQAKIYYQGALLQTNLVEIPRKDAGKLQFKVEKEGCPSQTYIFNKRKFRGWAFVGSLFFPTIVLNGFPIPIPTVVDFAVGAYWKPDANDPRIVKSDYDAFQYNLPFECGTKESTPSSLASGKQEKLLELKELFDKGMITEEEYTESRKKVLAQ